MTRNNNRSNNFSIVAVIAIVLILIVAFSGCGEGFDEALEGTRKAITYEVVNVRESPKGEVLTQLEWGTYVTLTGATYEITGSDGRNNDSWIEVILADGTTGWIVRNSVR